MHTKKRLAIVPAAILALAMTVSAGLAASEFEGKWNVKDSSGAPFEITLDADGSATGSREEGMTGTWKETGGAAVITWDTGWTTTIAKDGNGYKKSATKKDGSAGTDSPAEKAK